MTRVIIDCDPGIDDAVALLLACGSPEIDLLAVTTVAGNRPVDVTSTNACRILDAAGRCAVPVFAGCARPMLEAAPRCGLVHGENGLGGVVLPTDRAPRAEHAIDFIAGTLAKAEPNTVTIIAVGPLTNLALAEIKQPGLLRRAKSLLVMGGAAFGPGNITPCAEFNFFADALAAHTVLSAGAQVHLFGLDVTRKAAIPDEWVASLAALDTRCGRAASDMLRAYAAREPRLHDACPVAHVLDPTLFHGEPCSVSVDWRPGPTEGHTCVWPMWHRNRPALAPNATVFTDVDSVRLLALTHERIASLP
jgi:purine nucleosidase